MMKYARTVAWQALLLLTLWLPVDAAARPPPDRLEVLRHGINLTNWFRYPASLDPAALRSYLSDSAIGDLRQAGFGFVRLAVQPELLMTGARLEPLRLRLLLEAIRRLQRQGLGVVIAPFPLTWQPEADRPRLIALWQALAPELASLDPRLTFPEVLNEPVFANDAAGWARLQAVTLQTIRAALPGNTVVLTGQDWGSVAGLLALSPVADANVIYSIHYYDPSELTSLAAYRPEIDRTALARLPFPMAAGCTGGQTDRATADLIGFVCSMRWDAARVERRIGEASAWAGRNNAAVLLGEFGASVRLNAPARLAWLAAVRRAAENQQIGWALWGYDDSMGLDVSRPPGRPVLSPATLRSLGLSGEPAPVPPRR
jgi:endoglucanase